MNKKIGILAVLISVFSANLCFARGLSDDLNNVIQISPVFNQTFVALKSNGKMVFGDPDYDVSENGSANRNDKWLADIAKWDNIISFDMIIKFVLIKVVEF